VAELKAPAGADAAVAVPEQDLRVLVKGDVAAVTWTAGGTRGLKILARRAGQWQQVHQQTSPIVAANK
jgi:hypothetical protein